MGLKELYKEAEELNKTINEVNAVLDKPVVIDSVLYHTESFGKKFVDNSRHIIVRKANYLAKELSKAFSSGRPDKMLITGVAAIATAAITTATEVIPEAVTDIADSIEARKKASAQVAELKKELTVKQAMIIEEHSRIIKEQSEKKNASLKEQQEIAAKIQELNALIKKCNTLLNKTEEN